MGIFLKIEKLTSQFEMVILVKNIKAIIFIINLGSQK